jgi:cell division protein FtsB
MENQSLVLPGSLTFVLFGKGNPHLGVTPLTAIRLMFSVLILACIAFGVSVIHFHSRYQHEAQVARQLKSELRNQFEVTNTDHRILQAQVEDLHKTLAQTQIELALASRPAVFTTMPAPKDAPTAALDAKPLR